MSDQSRICRSADEVASIGLTIHGLHRHPAACPFGAGTMTAIRAIVLCLVLLVLPSVALSQDSEAAQSPSDDIGDMGLEELMEVEVVPINILGTHTHLEGEWMIGYQFKSMRMNGNRDGTSSVGKADVLRDFPVAPTDMSMEMHMAMLMYAPTDDLTLMAMLPYKRVEMDHVTRTGARFTTDSAGIGDLQLSGLYTFFRREFDQHRLILKAGVSVPTGSIDEKDFLANRTLGKLRLPYPMQLGSGTADLRPGITYLGQTDDWAWTVEAAGTIRLGRNKNKYSLGDRIHLSASGNWRATNWLAPFVRLDGEIWGDIDGADPDLNPALVPTADPNRRGGKRLDISFGVDLYVGEGILKGHRLAIQGGLPVYQNLDGPQLETDWHFSIGWQWIFQL